MSVTLGELKQRGLLRADLGNGDFISSDELTEYANASLAELYDVLVQSFDDHINPKVHSITLVSGTDSYNLPTDLYKIRKVRITDSTSTTNAWLDRCTLDEIGNDVYSMTGHFNSLKYYPLGTKIYFAPKPSGTDTVEVWYIPTHPYLTGDDQQIHYAIPVGWSEYVVLGVAIRCRTKEQTDTSGLVQERAMQLTRIMNAARNRDMGEPDQVVDKTGRYQRRTGWY